MEGKSSYVLKSTFFHTGYARLVLIIAAHHIKDESPETAVLLYAIFAACDGIDGYAARKLNQCSSFGAWVKDRLKKSKKLPLISINLLQLDVIIDNIGRTLIWSNFKVILQ